MDLHQLALGWLNVFQPLNLLMIFTGLFVGIIAGALPGITFFNAIVLVLPFTYLMDVEPAILLLSSIYCAGVFGGSITGILFNIPGDPMNVPTTWEGFKLAQQGHAEKALGVAIMCSAIGGFLSAVVMTVFSPWLAQFALLLSSAEYFSVVLLGLTSVAVIGQHSMGSSIISLSVGLFLGTLGIDSIYGESRFTFGLSYLDPGINFITALLGLFAIGEIIEQVSFRSGYAPIAVGATGSRAAIPSLTEFVRRRWTIVRGFVAGVLVGVVPAAGATVASFVSYGLERACSKTPEKFGTGHWEGLMASETSNNASTGGAMIPLLTLGIPGSGATAVLLAAFVLHGIQPGPLLFVTSPQMLYTIFAGMLAANLFMIFGGLVCARGITYIMRVPAPVLMSFILSFCLLGAYATNNSMADVWFTVAFGVLGFLCRRLDVPTAPMILGLILGPLAERFFVTTMVTESNDWTVFFTRPVSAVLIAMAGAMLILPVAQWFVRRRIA